MGNCCSEPKYVRPVQFIKKKARSAIEKGNHAKLSFLLSSCVVSTGSAAVKLLDLD